MVSKPTTLDRPEGVGLAELDARLDLSIEAFDAGARALVAEFREQGHRVVIPSTSAVGRARHVNSTRQYHAELARLPEMDRATEFRMAKRHEFLQLRVEDALLRAGFAPEQIEALRKRSFTHLPAAPRPEGAPYLRQALAELGALRNLFLEGGLHLVLSTAYRYRSLGVDLVDLIQEGNASLFQAISKFDWRRDVRFRTYAQFWIQQAILKTLYNSSRTVRIPVWVQKLLRKAQRIQQASPVPISQLEVARRLAIPVERLEELTRLRRGSVSLDAVLPGTDQSHAQLLPDPKDPAPPADAALDLGGQLDEVMAELPPRERSILIRRYGLRGTEPETLGEIANDFGITAERVRQLQNAAVRRLQNSPALRQLSDYESGA